MRVGQICWNGAEGWRETNGAAAPEAPQLVLYFGGRDRLACGDAYRALRARYPEAHLLGCSTGGEILDEEVYDDTVAAAVIEFEKSTLKVAAADAGAGMSSTDIGRALGEALQAPDLRGVFVLSDGTQVNGSELVAGLNAAVPSEIPVTGGLAGDGARFETTLVGVDHAPAPGRVAAVGFYGPHVAIGHGSIGGWDDFGPQRTITRSEANVLYELDGKPALELYKTYLGDEARNLPGSALLFPLKVRPTPGSNSDVVRTIVGVDEEKQSMTFAGNVPEGYTAQLMRGNFENLIEGAASAAELAAVESTGDSLAILVSCIGRKLLLGQRIVEEAEAVRETLGGEVPQIGFYSYGEISPHSTSGRCELHNQTMTITVLAEA